MAKPRSVKVQTNPNNSLKDIIILQETIREVAAFAKKLNESKLTRRAIVVLIQDSIGASRIKKNQIEDVLDCAESLGQIYLKQDESESGL